MEARNAAGCRVSLLNDVGVGVGCETKKQPLVYQPQQQKQQQYPQHQQHHQQRQQHPHLGFQALTTSRILSRPYPSPPSSSSSPNTPELLRSDSYDSQTSNDPISPLTPSVEYVYPRGGLYGSELPPKPPAYVSSSSRATSYDDDTPAAAAAAAASAALPSASERPAKRYPCRYRDTHGCEKTFTTSGHASRHSKIHTAEKAVQCTYPGCQKKFTRADNMKQHLETHYKDKSRSSASQRAHKIALAEARRISSTGRRGSPACCTTSTSSVGSNSDAMQWESDALAVVPSQQKPLPSPTAARSSWDMRAGNPVVPTRPAAARSPSSGLDALAMAIACQEGAARP